MYCKINEEILFSSFCNIVLNCSFCLNSPILKTIFWYSDDFHDYIWIKTMNWDLQTTSSNTWGRIGRSLKSSVTSSVVQWWDAAMAVMRRLLRFMIDNFISFSHRLQTQRQLRISKYNSVYFMMVSIKVASYHLWKCNNFNVSMSFYCINGF